MNNPSQAQAINLFTEVTLMPERTDHNNRPQKHIVVCPVSGLSYQVLDPYAGFWITSTQKHPLIAEDRLQQLVWKESHKLPAEYLAGAILELLHSNDMLAHPDKLTPACIVGWNQALSKAPRAVLLDIHHTLYQFPQWLKYEQAKAQTQNPGAPVPIELIKINLLASSAQSTTNILALLASLMIQQGNRGSEEHKLDYYALFWSIKRPEYIEGIASRQTIKLKTRIIKKEKTKSAPKSVNMSISAIQKRVPRLIRQVKAAITPTDSFKLNAVFGIATASRIIAEGLYLDLSVEKREALAEFLLTVKLLGIDYEVFPQDSMPARSLNKLAEIVVAEYVPAEFAEYESFNDELDSAIKGLSFDDELDKLLEEF